MKDWQSQAHVKWECKYHVVIIPKYRKKALYGKVRRKVGEILRELCQQRGIELLEGKTMPDHVHMLLSVPPKYSIAHTIGFLKGKSAVRIHRNVLKTKALCSVAAFGQEDTVSARLAGMKKVFVNTSGNKKNSSKSSWA
jgi:putative transposase